MSDKGKVIKRLGGIRCPRCNKEIDFFNFSAKVEHFGLWDDINSWETRDYGDWSNLKLACPHCDKVLFTNEDKALKFLQGEG